MKKNEKTVILQELVDFGFPCGLFSCSLKKEIEIDIIIVATLQNGYNTQIISQLYQFFGNSAIISAFQKHREKISDKLFSAVMGVK